jgi:hypothetical protein
VQLLRLHKEGHPSPPGRAGEFRVAEGQERADGQYIRHRHGPAHILFALRDARVYVPRSQPDRITVNARCLDGVDGPSLKPSRFFDGRHWEEAQHRRIAEGGHAAAAGLNGAVTLKAILDRALE